MAEHTYRAAIVGLGFIGGGDQVSGDRLGQQVVNLDGTHVEALTRNARIQLVAGSSRDEGRRQRFAARTGVPTYADWAELLAREEPELVSIATYAPVHAEITRACAARGARAVYCEKPIATRLCDADRMSAACAKAGTLLVVNHNRRFNANLRRLRDFVAGGGLGDLAACTLEWGSGRLGNVGTHMFDALRMLTGRAVEAVSGTLDLSRRPDCRGAEFHDPGGWGLLRLAGGLVCTVHASDYGGMPCRMVLTGQQGRAVVDRYDVTIERWDGTREEWPGRDPDTTGMDRAVAEIVAWLDDGTPVPHTAGEAIHALEVITAFHVSHERDGAWVELPLRGADRDREVQSG
jgi:predicted dehydrogenase